MKRRQVSKDETTEHVSDATQVTKETSTQPECTGNLSLTHPDNREAVSKFGVISGLLLIAPLVLYFCVSHFEWSIEAWGFISVVVMNLIMGCYAYLVFLEEGLEQKQCSYSSVVLML